MSRSIAIGATLTLVFLGLAALSFIYTPYDIQSFDIPNKLHRPDATNLLGTDHFGRDILSMIMLCARTSIAFAVPAVAIGTCTAASSALPSAARP